MADVSFKIPLCEGELLVLHYLNEKESEEVGAQPGCLGSPQEPFAEPGNFCAFTGGFKGVNEKVWKNAKFFKIQSTSGNSEETSAPGEMIVFRSTEFNEEKTVEKLLATKSPVYFASGGGWAVTAK